MKTNRFTLVVMLLLSWTSIDAQSTPFCEDEPPSNPFLADSPWPTYHRNNYRQASTCLPGPVSGDSLRVVAKTGIQGSTSPWTYLSEEYPDGERVLTQSNSTHFFKMIDLGDEIVTVDSIRIDFDPITSFGWNFLQTPGPVWYTYDPKYDPENNRYTRLYRIEDETPGDAFSDLIVTDTFSFQDLPVTKVQNYGINYNGQIVFTDGDLESLLNKVVVGVLSPDLVLLDTLELSLEPGEIAFHNAWPIDENNSIFQVTTRRMIRYDWDGEELSIGWEAPYDFVADGPTGSFAEGSGTTPTLMGWGDGNDKLVVVADGHANNNLVAFWRDTIPDGWAGIPGEDPRLAGLIPLPAANQFSNLFQSIENSPTVYGYEIAIAQFNGFLGQNCPTVKGIQKLHWDVEDDSWAIDWVNEEINMNGVLTYSSGSDLVYGSGRADDCNYYYYALDWQTGDLEWSILLGPEGTFANNPWDDGGVNHIIGEQANIYFAGTASLVKIEIVEDGTNSSSDLDALEENFHLFPNPVIEGDLHLSLPAAVHSDIVVAFYDNFGREVLRHNINAQNSVIDIRSLQAGVYLASFMELNGRRISSQQVLITD